MIAEDIPLKFFKMDSISNGGVEGTYLGAIIDRPMSSGKWYWNFATLYLDQAPKAVVVGVARPERRGRHSELGSDAQSWGWRGDGVFLTGGQARPAEPIGTGGQARPAGPANLVMLAYDADAGSLWIGYDGHWIDGGDPAKGLRPNFTGISGPVVPAVSVARIGDFSGYLGLRDHPEGPIPAGFKPLPIRFRTGADLEVDPVTYKALAKGPVGRALPEMAMMLAVLALVVLPWPLARRAIRRFGLGRMWVSPLTLLYLTRPSRFAWRFAGVFAFVLVAAVVNARSASISTALYRPDFTCRFLERQYLAIVEANRAIGRYDPSGDAWFWYRTDETAPPPPGCTANDLALDAGEFSISYTSIYEAVMYSRYRELGPVLRAASFNVFPVDKSVKAQPFRVVVLSSHPKDHETALDAIRKVATNVTVDGRIHVAQPGIAFDISVIEGTFLPSESRR